MPLLTPAVLPLRRETELVCSNVHVSITRLKLILTVRMAVALLMPPQFTLTQILFIATK